MKKSLKSLFLVLAASFSLIGSGCDKENNMPLYEDNLIENLDATGRFELAPSVLFGGLMKNVEINCKGVHKGNGLKKLTEHLGFTMNDVMALGDSDNDLTMLEMSGLSIAMGNAEDHIKEVADECTLTNIEFGVAHSIKKHLL